MNDRHIHILTFAGAVMGAVAYLGAVGGGLVGHSPAALDRRIDTLEARPIVLPAALATAQPTVMTYEQWRASEPRLIATRDEAETALIEAGMTPRAAASLTHLVQTCESPVKDRTGTSIGIDLQAVGDNGLSRGPFQIHVGWNPQYADTYLFDLNESARAATRIWLEAGRSLSPWSCR